MRGKKLFYLGERHNPQFSKPYYKKYGQLTKKEAAEKEKCVYGSMYLTAFDSEEEYQKAIEEKKEKGYSIH